MIVTFPSLTLCDRDMGYDPCNGGTCGPTPKKDLLALVAIPSELSPTLQPLPLQIVLYTGRVRITKTGALKSEDAQGPGCSLL